MSLTPVRRLHRSVADAEGRRGAARGRRTPTAAADCAPMRRRVRQNRTKISVCRTPCKPCAGSMGGRQPARRQHGRPAASKAQVGSPTRMRTGRCRLAEAAPRRRERAPSRHAGATNRKSAAQMRRRSTRDDVPSRPCTLAPCPTRDPARPAFAFPQRLCPAPRAQRLHRAPSERRPVPPTQARHRNRRFSHRIFGLSHPLPPFFEGTATDSLEMQEGDRPHPPRKAALRKRGRRRSATNRKFRAKSARRPTRRRLTRSARRPRARAVPAAPTRPRARRARTPDAVLHSPFEHPGGSEPHGTRQDRT